MTAAYSFDGTEQHTVRPGESVVIFRSVGEIDTYVQDPLGEKWAAINSEGFYVMYYKNIGPTLFDSMYNTKFLFKVLTTPFTHPEYGYIAAWGLWNHILK